VNSLATHFHTDWAALTLTDWIGMTLTVAIALALAWVYFQTFRPAHRERLEAHKHIPFAEDEPRGDLDGRP